MYFNEFLYIILVILKFYFKFKCRIIICYSMLCCYFLNYLIKNINVLY